MIMTLSLIAGLPIYGLSLTASAASIHKWTDLEGNVHFGDQPSTDVRAVKIHVPQNSTSAVAIDVESSGIEAQPQRMRERKPENQAARRYTRAVSIHDPTTIKFENWLAVFVDKYHANRGTNCDDPSYQDGHRPLTSAEQNQVKDAVHARREREWRELEYRIRHGQY